MWLFIYLDIYSNEFSKKIINIKNPKYIYPKYLQPYSLPKLFYVTRT